MDKIVKVLNVLGNFAWISIDGNKVKARVEGNIPSNVFLGEVLKEGDKVIVRVKDNLIAKDITRVLLSIDLPRNLRNYLITKILMSLDIPIERWKYDLLKDFDLPPLLSALVLKSKGSDAKKHLFLVDVVYREVDKKVDKEEFEFFFNSIFLDEKRFVRVFDDLDENGSRWFGYFEFEEEGIRKIVLSARLGSVDVLVVFERVRGGYSVSINFFGEVDISSSGVDELRSKLEDMGFKPINIGVNVYGGSDEKSGSIEV